MSTDQIAPMTATPEPWQRHGSHVYGPDPERRLVCQIHYEGNPEDDANAQLILEAPTLRAALRVERAKVAESDGLLASATDLLNSWARESGVVEAARVDDIQGVVDRLWSRVSLQIHEGLKARHERDAALAIKSELLEALEAITIASQGVPNYLGTDRNGNCTLLNCRCSNHLAFAAIARAGVDRTPCIGRDPKCPCQDGDMCHYKGPNAMPIPDRTEKPEGK